MTDHAKNSARRAFADRFRLALEELGISPGEQGRLARMFNVSGAAVRKWLEGSAMPTSARIPQIADLLQVNRGWLQYGEGPMRLVTTRDNDDWGGQRLTPEEARLLVRYRALDDDQRRAIDLVLYSMVVRSGRADRKEG